GVGNDTTCTHGYFYSGGYGCACPGYSTTYAPPYYASGAAAAPFADCDAFGTAVGSANVAAATGNKFITLPHIFMKKIQISCGSWDLKSLFLTFLLTAN
ncbi:unnamed protein product, partial [Rotaria socialis]